MNPDKFCTWLSGFLEAVGTQGLSPEQVETVKDRLPMPTFDAMMSGVVNQLNPMPMIPMPKKLAKTDLERAQDHVAGRIPSSEL